jgi:hypothetical protein
LLNFSIFSSHAILSVFSSYTVLATEPVALMRNGSAGPAAFRIQRLLPGMLYGADRRRTPFMGHLNRCISPFPVTVMKYLRLDTLEKRFPWLPVGGSGHGSTLVRI